MVKEDPVETLPPEVYAEIQSVVDRAKGGDGTAVPRLRELLKSHPALWKRVGDLAAQAERSWLSLFAGKNLHMLECAARDVVHKRQTLTRPNASPAEVLLVERLVACFVRVQYFSAMEAQALAEGAGLKLQKWYAERLDQAQRQYERALVTLLNVQKVFAVSPAKEQSYTSTATAKQTSHGKTPDLLESEIPEHVHNRVEQYFRSTGNSTPNKDLLADLIHS